MTTTETAWRERVARPDGTAYRARKAPRVEEFATPDASCGGFLVIRTHDVDVATALVDAYWRGMFDVPLPAPLHRWVRLVPWDDEGGHDMSWLDANPRDRGAIPAVEFRAEDTW